MSELSKNIFAFHVDLLFLELFQFTHGTFFVIPCRFRVFCGCYGIPLLYLCRLISRTCQIRVCSMDPSHVETASLTPAVVVPICFRLYSKAMVHLSKTRVLN